MKEQDEEARLAAVYGAMYDEQLLELAVASSDLTDVAKGVLRDELNRRRLEAPKPKQGIAELPPRFAVANRSMATTSAPVIAPDGSEVEYTWKVELATFADSKQASLVKTALEASGFECFFDSWRESYSSFKDEQRFVRLQVPADQFEDAKTYLLQLTPEKLNEYDVPADPGDFVTPACPRCKAADVLLLSADPRNNWQCETCGAEWADDI